VFGLLSPNGASKTTLLRTLAWVIPPSSGTIRLLGHDERVLIDGRAGSKLRTLSGGMLRRAGIAQAIVNDPPGSGMRRPATRRF
jgi:ABC-type multidrug transport system ATPase subunit